MSHVECIGVTSIYPKAVSSPFPVCYLSEGGTEEWKVNGERNGRLDEMRSIQMRSGLSRRDFNRDQINVRLEKKRRGVERRGGQRRGVERRGEERRGEDTE